MNLEFFELEENGLYSRSSDSFSEKAYSEEIIEKLNARPCRRSVRKRLIVPSESGSEVHNAGSREDALRGEVRAIAAYIVEVVIGGISRERPFFCVCRGRGAIVCLNVHTSFYVICIAFATYAPRGGRLSRRAAFDALRNIFRSAHTFSAPAGFLSPPAFRYPFALSDAAIW